METSELAKTSTNNLYFSKSPKTLARNPQALLVERISSTLIYHLNMIAETNGVGAFPLEMIAPLALGLYEFLTLTGTLLSIASCIAMGWRMLAPK